MALKQLGPREIAVSSPDDMGADEDEERATGITHTLEHELRTMVACLQRREGQWLRSS